MHDFGLTTFSLPTYCEYCAGFLWGLTKQGVRCSKCHSTAHKKCAIKAATVCTGDRGLATLVRATTGSFHDSALSSRSSMVAGQSPQAPDTSAYARQLDCEFWLQVDEETKLNSLVSAQAEQPLSLFQTLPANFMQFTAKLAPLTILHRGAQDIVLWRRPRYSLAAMCVYSAYCLRPNLLLATPLALAICYIIFTFYNSGYAAHCVEHHGVGRGIPRSQTTATLAESVSTSAPSSPPSNPINRGGGSSLFNSSSSTVVSLSSGKLRDRRKAHMAKVSQSQTAPIAAALVEPSGQQKTMTAAATESSADRNRPVVAHVNTVAHAALSPPKGKVLVRSRSSSETPASYASSRGGGSAPPFKPSAMRHIDLAAELGVASFGSAKYTANVHTTQNLTGTYVRVYDWVAAHNHLVDWSQPSATLQILLACISAQVVLVVALYWIPWCFLFLLAGNIGLLAMSPHVRAFAKVYGVEFMLYTQEAAVLWWLRQKRRLFRLPLLGRLFKKYFLREHQGTMAGGVQLESPAPLMLESSETDDGESHEKLSGYTTPPMLSSLCSTAGSSTSTLMRRPHTVSVYENQRWWFGFGWIPRLGSNERAKWSDQTGKVRYASVNDFMPEDGYEWVDENSGWEVDRLWALPVHTDEDGWVYTDNFWKHPAAVASTVASYTRRRRWVRKVRPVSRLDSSRANSAALVM